MLVPGASDFTKLNQGWDAQGGTPCPEVHCDEPGLRLAFFLRPDENIRDHDRGEMFFPSCWRYRLGPTNDEGWERGQCRFRCLAPDWGDFYEVTGDLLENRIDDWIVIGPRSSESSRHFLFYFKDDTFECDAEDWSFRILPTPDADYQRLRTAEVRIALPRTTVLSLMLDLIAEPFRWTIRAYRRMKY
jgi:hypothetical protein